MEALFNGCHNVTSANEFLHTSRWLVLELSNSAIDRRRAVWWPGSLTVWPGAGPALYAVYLEAHGRPIFNHFLALSPSRNKLRK